MWDSEVTPWNVMDKGPKRDITGELQKSITSRGMKFITTFHHAKNLQRGTIGNNNRFSHYPLYEGMPTTSTDPELSLLYGNVEREKWFKEIWLGKLVEVIDKYHPDIMWFDYVLDSIPEKYRQEYSAYYLNAAQKWNKEVVIVRKQDDLPLSISMDDLEKSRKNKIGTKVWMTDETISKGSWSYTQDLEVKEARDVLHVLIHIVSKNGVLLLNVSPKSDGTIPQEQQEVLIKIGDWLRVHSEAIYGTRPWYTYGEGPVKEPEGHYDNANEFLKIKYSSKDIRYTTQDEIIYATLMGVPGDKVTMSAFSGQQLPSTIKVKSIELLGSEDDVQWEMTSDGLGKQRKYWH